MAFSSMEWDLSEALADFFPHAITKAEVLANIERILAGEEPEIYAAIADDDSDD